MASRPMKYRNRLEALNRRVDFLAQRIEDRQIEGGTYDKLEMSALVWAINFIEEYPDLALGTIKTKPEKALIGQEKL